MSEGQPPTMPPQHGLPPISQPFPGSLTPGWNDPPSVQYNPTSSGTPGRTKLNKRVPFPLQSANTTKPTAIVQPQIPQQTIGMVINSGNIAVVHPLQHTQTEAPASPAILPHFANTGLASSTEQPTGTTREISNQNPMHAPQSSDVTLPTMFVPAVPRSDVAPTQSTVQHL